MDRPDTFKLDLDTPFLRDPAGQKLCALLEDAGHKALFVGGCVRNAVMGIPASDVDLATDALPLSVIDLATAAGWRAIPTGIDHGTVTVVVDHAPFEVTTFRRDVATDGRRAVVAFSNDITKDALRRDFTMNALYADRRGDVHDPLGGLSDARAGRVLFIQDAGQRIAEDYLRILRFFRFSAYYAADPGSWDADALAAIAAHLDGLETLSPERIGGEMIKLLSAPDPVPALAVMDQTGVLQRILPGASITFVGPLVHLEQVIQVASDAISRLAALGGVDAVDRLRLSRKDQKTLAAIQDNCVSRLGPEALGHTIGEVAALGSILLRAAMQSQPLPNDTADRVRAGAQAVFPVSARDLPEFSGPALGRRLAALKQEWLASGLTKSGKDLLGA